MNVTDAVVSRRSVRQFLDNPVDQATLARVLAKAQRSPSGGNTPSRAFWPRRNVRPPAAIRSLGTPSSSPDNHWLT